MAKKLTLIIFLLLIVCALVYFFTKKNGSNINETKMTANETTQEKNIPAEKIAGFGDTVAVNYTGKLENGKVFDSNTDPFFNHVEPLYFTIGTNIMIRGFSQGVIGMKVGEEKTITVSPEDGYGAAGREGVPPNSTLIFEVKLLEIK